MGGEKPGVGGRGSPNKVPIVAAVSTTAEGRPVHAKISVIPGFSIKPITDWARLNLMPGCHVLCDGLGCLSGVIDAGCAHSYIVVADRKPRDLPKFTWVNTVLANLKTMINGAHKAFKFNKYAELYLGAFCYRFNRRSNLRAIVGALIGHGATAKPLRERAIRDEAEVHD